MIYDHKAHCEADPAKHQTMTVKFVKHVADGVWGLIIDTILCTVKLFVVNHQISIKRRNSHDKLKIYCLIVLVVPVYSIRLTYITLSFTETKDTSLKTFFGAFCC